MAGRGIDEVLGAYDTPGTSMAWPGERELVRDRGDRDVRQQNAWDAATGDPNQGYGVRLPSPLSGARAAVGRGARAVGDALFGWMTPAQKEQAAVASNFLGPPAPLAKAMFMTPAMVKRAADVLPAGRGSTEAWGDARSMIGGRSIGDLLDMRYSDPALLSRIYDETGWMPPYTMSPHQDRALAWHATPVSLTPTASRKAAQGEVGGTFGSLLAKGDGKDAVLTAAPWLKDTQLMVDASPRRVRPDGTTEAPMPGEWSGMVGASGPTLDDVMAVLHHEMFHAGPQANMRKLGVDTTQDIPRTAAERIYEGNLKRAEKRGSPLGVLDEIENRRAWATDYARYLNDPFEHLARASTLYELDPRLAATRPDLVDTFTDAANARVSPKARAIRVDPNLVDLEYRHFMSPEAPFYRAQPDK